MLSVARQLCALTVALAGTAVTAQGQVTVRRPNMGAADDSTRVTLSLTVGSERFDETKRGRCMHAPTASIYGTLAAMWTVEYPVSPGRSLNMSVWRPLRGDSTAQMNFQIGGGPSSQRIATVKGTKTVGDGTVAFVKRGAGGRFNIAGTTGTGATVRGHVDCEKFSAPMAVGGN